MTPMKWVIVFTIALSTALSAAEESKPSYGDELWTQYVEHEKTLLVQLKSAENKTQSLKPVPSDGEAPKSVVARWAKQRTGRSREALEKERAQLTALGKLTLECRNAVRAQQERMRTIQFVQTQTNDLEPRVVEKALDRLADQINRLVTIENGLMGKMGLPIEQMKGQQDANYDPLGLLPGCPLCQLSGSPNGLPGHVNTAQDAILPDPNTFDSGLNP